MTGKPEVMPHPLMTSNRLIAGDKATWHYESLR
jgi:hypothetical protein